MFSFRGAFRSLIKRTFSTKIYIPKSHNVIKEIQKTVDPYSSLEISSNIPIKIVPYDLIDCPDANQFRAKFYTSGGSEKPEMFVDVQEKNIKVISQGDSASSVCLLEVPVKSDLTVKSQNSVQVNEMYSDFVRIDAAKNITTSNLRSTTIDLSTDDGDIQCDGLVLAKNLRIHSQKGNIILDKLQGDILHCKAFNGNISVSSCYVENSHFVTEIGNMILKNLHKTSEIYVLDKGNIEISGIHGNIYLKSQTGDLNLQFSEIIGDNIVMASDSKNVIINISDAIEETSFIEIGASSIALNETAEHLKKFKVDENLFRFGDENQVNKLLICTKGSLVLGKLSWADRMKQMFDLKEEC